MHPEISELTRAELPGFVLLLRGTNVKQQAPRDHSSTLLVHNHPGYWMTRNSSLTLSRLTQTRVTEQLYPGNVKSTNAFPTKLVSARLDARHRVVWKSVHAHSAVKHALLLCSKFCTLRSKRCSSSNRRNMAANWLEECDLVEPSIASLGSVRTRLDSADDDHESVE